MPNASQYIVPALKTALIYAVFGGLWIVLSDRLLGLMVTDLETYATIQTYKGWLYILITAGLVYHLSLYHLKKAIELQQEAELGEERYEMALSGADVGLWDWNITTGDVVFSKEYTSMLGYDNASFPPIYQSWEALVHPDDKPDVLQIVQAHLDGKTENFSMEFRMLTADKTWKWIQARGKVSQRDEDGNPARCIGVHIDLTKRMETEKALEVAKEAAEAGSLAKSRFLSNLSNEIRTPLHGVMGMLRLLRTEKLTAQQTEFVAAADASAHNLLEVVNDLTTISRGNTPNSDICTEHIDIGLLKETIARVFRAPLQESDIEFRFTVDPGIPNGLCGDQGKLRQILFSLIGNALRSTEQGEVVVEATAIEDPRTPGTAILLFTLKDSGPGISDDQFQRIFEGIDREQDDELIFGLGVGLRVVSRLVSLLGGSICVDNTGDQGTFVHFSINAHFDDKTFQVECADSLLSDRASLHVLVVEDDAINRALLKHFLARSGHLVTTVNDGLDVLPILRENDFDCIFMDIRMPGMDGMETTQAIRTNKELGHKAHIPIIALTAHAHPEERQVYLDRGMTGFLTKPVTLDELMRELERAVPKHTA